MTLSFSLTHVFMRVADTFLNSYSLVNQDTLKEYHETPQAVTTKNRLLIVG